MTSITVKNLPPELYNEVKRLATEDRRSINSEIIELLSESTAWRKKLRDMRNDAVELDALIASMPRSAVDSVDLLREDRYGDR